MPPDTLSSSIQGPDSARRTRPVSASLDEGWIAALQQILAEPQCVRVHYQPIVDLQRGLVRGYEALARFPEVAGVGPRDWFVAAARLGFAGALESQLLQAALVTRPLLIRDRFIAVNVSPQALLSPEVQTVLANERSLEQLVVELIDLDDGADHDAVAAALTALRGRGAMIAVDVGDAGSRSLDRVTALHPHFVKVEGAVIAGIEHDEAAAETIRALGAFAAKLDAWVVAEGIETPEQLDALVRLGVPLGQGFALGRPVAAMAELDREVARRMRQRTLGGVNTERLRGLKEAALVVPIQGGTDAVTAAFDAEPHAEYAIVLAPDGRPVGVLDRPAHDRGTPPRAPLCLFGVMPVTDAARRAMARPLGTRFDPVAIVDQRGAYVGVVPIDRIVGALAG